MNKEEIISKYPSLCYTCSNNRRPAADSNAEKGYVGCTKFAEDKDRDLDNIPDVSFITEAEEIAEGWVDLRARVFNEKSGIITNYQLITKGVRKCKEYQLLK